MTHSSQETLSIINTAKVISQVFLKFIILPIRCQRLLCLSRQLAKSSFLFQMCLQNAHHHVEAKASHLPEYIFP